MYVTPAHYQNHSRSPHKHSVAEEPVLPQSDVISVCDYAKGSLNRKRTKSSPASLWHHKYPSQASLSPILTTFLHFRVVLPVMTRHTEVVKRPASAGDQQQRTVMVAGRPKLLGKEGAADETVASTGRKREWAWADWQGGVRKGERAQECDCSFQVGLGELWGLKAFAHTTQTHTQPQGTFDPIGEVRSFI